MLNHDATTDVSILIALGKNLFLLNLNIEQENLKVFKKDIKISSFVCWLIDIIILIGDDLLVVE